MSLDDASTSLPTREASRRKRIRKNIGPDFVSDYFSSGRGSSNSNIAETAAVKRALRLSSRQDRLKLPLEPKLRQEKVVLKEATPEPAEVCAECGTATGTFPIHALSERRFIHCTNESCPYLAHAGCAGVTDGSETDFKCPDCRKCVICGHGRVRKNKRLIQCFNCYRVYHTECHTPPVDFDAIELWGNKMCILPGWKCCECVDHTNESPPLEPEGTSAALDHSPKSLSLHNNGIVDAHNSGSQSNDFATTDIPPRSRSAEPNSSAETVLSLRALTPDLPTNEPVQKPASPSRSAVVPQTATSSAVPAIVITNGHVCRFEKYFEDASYEERELRQDLAMWSVEQCAAFFIDSQPELAELIYKHELYGSSLMLISRSQFSKLFGLSVGKSLKFFGAICKWRKLTF